MRIVTRLPLTELWDAAGPVEAVRIRDLGEDDVRERLRLRTSGVVATISEPLRWLRDDELFAWWKSEARPRLLPADVERFRLEDFPGDRCWRATEWKLADGSIAVVFEEHH